MQRVFALVGPTAVGKSAVAVELAQLLGAEIVSCDSMQVYRHMRILTQAPTHGQRTQVQHHLIDCIEPTSDFSVGEFRKMAAPIIDQILARGRRALIVGGTGLYLKALTEGLCDAPPADVRVREQLWSECQGVGSETLHNRLQSIDQVAASRIHPNDARRIIRALEVYTLTGKPISSWWRQASAELLHGQVMVIGITRTRAALYERINARLLEMIYEHGVINEVRELLRLPLSRTARQVHGLADIEQYLTGKMSLKDTVAIWQQRVRQYA
ncbi:MAG: tRNA (adenosine(37)-N6)-dimethylallyltransferase MiaA, partial [Candidatus Omnitrophica bacterium CG11_big_fil_rev_8_21_14_0_20_63_9]